MSAIIGRVRGGAVHIELWVMSCRVFKREFELAMFDALAAACLERGVRTILGAYLPTAKNAPVKGLYPSLGFAAVAETPQKAEYRYDIPAAYVPKCRCIAVNETHPVQGGSTMTDAELLKKLEEIFRENFDDSTITLTPATGPDDIEEWDSLEQINLLTALGAEFGIQLGLADIRGVRTVGDMMALVREKAGL